MTHVRSQPVSATGAPDAANDRRRRAPTEEPVGPPTEKQQPGRPERSPRISEQRGEPATHIYIVSGS
jgi:hypothetical protein